MRRKLTYDPARDYYTILEIGTHATTNDIRQAFRQRVRAVHPDLNPERAAWATEQIQLVNEAYSILSDTATRREYDALRWPHIQHAPPRYHATPRSEPPPYDPNRPWWEQVAERAPRGYPFSTSADPTAPSPFAAARPRWLIIGDWLRAHRLGALERTWITLTGLWRSPYAGLLAVLMIVLALNVALIIYAVMKPDTFTPLEDWLRTDNSGAAEIATPTGSTPTLTLLNQHCADPLMTIMLPASGDIVSDEFSVYGTVAPTQLWAYELAIGYLGMSRSEIAPDIWQTVRAVPLNQSLAEQPITADLLTETPISLSAQPAGYYAIRLRIMLITGDVIEPCDVIVLH